MTRQNIILSLCAWSTLLACGNAVPNGDAAPETSSPTAQNTRPSEEAATQTSPTSTPPTENEVRQADSHTHGDANLAVIVEGTSLTIELETPLYNLTGFEHAPETEEQTSIIEAAEAKLMQPEDLFQANTEAGCVATDTGLEVHLGEEDHDEEEHEDEHGGDDHGSDTDDIHQDILITYMFTCDTPNRLSEIDISLLNMFPYMTELEVSYLGDVTQRLFTLDQTSTKINLRP
ncbi:MAG: DUF2796 domain-containing protein [Hyphomonadaceae bacterium]